MSDIHVMHLQLWTALFQRQESDPTSGYQVAMGPTPPRSMPQLPLHTIRWAALPTCMAPGRLSVCSIRLSLPACLRAHVAVQQPAYPALSTFSACTSAISTRITVQEFVIEGPYISWYDPHLQIFCYKNIGLQSRWAQCTLVVQCSPQMLPGDKS